MHASQDAPRPSPPPAAAPQPSASGAPAPGRRAPRGTACRPRRGCNTLGRGGWAGASRAGAGWNSEGSRACCWLAASCKQSTTCPCCRPPHQYTSASPRSPSPARYPRHAASSATSSSLRGGRHQQRGYSSPSTTGARDLASAEQSVLLAGMAALRLVKRQRQRRLDPAHFRPMSRLNEWKRSAWRTWSSGEGSSAAWPTSVPPPWGVGRGGKEGSGRCAATAAAAAAAALHRAVQPIRLQSHPALQCLSACTFSHLREGHNRGHRGAAAGRFQHPGLAALHHSHRRVGSSKIDPHYRRLHMQAASPAAAAAEAPEGGREVAGEAWRAAAAGGRGAAAAAAPVANAARWLHSRMRDEVGVGTKPSARHARASPAPAGRSKPALRCCCAGHCESAYI